MSSGPRPLPPTVDPLAAIEGAQDAIAFDDLEGNIVFVNRAFRRMVGLSEHSALGHIEDYVAPESHDDVWRRHHARIAGAATPMRYQVEVVRLDGTRLWVEASVTTITQDGQVVGSCAILRDISQQRERESALRQLERQYRDLFEQAFDALVVFEPEQELVLDANRRACELYGRTREEMIGMSLLTVSPRPQPGRLAIEQLERGPVQNLQTVQLHKDGSELRLECNASMIEYQGRKAVLSINRDISERLRIHERLAHADKMEGIGRLATGVAHEFNNVLASILGTAEALLDEVASHEHRALLEQMIARGHAGAKITRKLWALSRAPHGSAEVTRPDSCVQSMFGWLAPLLGEGIDLTLRPGAPGSAVQLDRGQLEQLLLNLAINARDAMGDAGSLRISTSCVELTSARQTSTHHLSPGRYVVIEVRDTGPGIPPESLPRIFEPFYTTKARENGTGLGLATVYAIVERAGGAIDVLTDGGACFTIYLPEAPEIRREVEVPASSKRQAVRATGSLLLVDDEVIITSTLARGLRAAGYEVLTANDAASALELLLRRTSPIDVLVTDLSMPGGDGIELAREAAALVPGLKVLLMSGHADRQPPADLEIVSFLQKPFTRSMLVEHIQALLDR